MLVLLVHVEHQHGDMRRRVELDVAIAQRSSLRTNEQPHRFVVGAVGAARKPVYEEVLGRLALIGGAGLSEIVHVLCFSCSL